MRRMCSFALLLCILAHIDGCAGTKGAVDPVVFTYVTYETLSPACAEAVAKLVIPARTRLLTVDEMERLGRLKLLTRLLDSYQKAYNLYVDTRKADLRTDIRRLLDDVIDLGVSLNLSFEARRL